MVLLLTVRMKLLIQLFIRSFDSLICYDLRKPKNRKFDTAVVCDCRIEIEVNSDNKIMVLRGKYESVYVVEHKVFFKIIDSLK